jgi:hypothetical protein
MQRWTQDRDVPKVSYDSARDPKSRGWHYVWEGGGFGIQVFKNGKGRERAVQLPLDRGLPYCR